MIRTVIKLLDYYKHPRYVVMRGVECEGRALFLLCKNARQSNEYASAWKIETRSYDGD